jgi:prolyl-tRNA synthetase
MAKEQEKQLGITVKKDEDFSEWYTQVIQRAELIEYTDVSGCIVFRPYSYAIWEEIQKHIDKLIKERGVKNAYFPLLIPEKLLMKEKEHVEGFTPEVAWVTHAGNTKLSERLAIRPTSETIMYDAYKKWIRSHRDLPLKINQWCNVVRWEFKHAVPFLRTREFLWQEGHTVFATKKEAEDEVLDILENVYAKTLKDVLALPSLLGRKSENEKFAGAEHTLSAEIFLPNGKAIQACTSHYLGQNFAKAFDITFLNEKSEREFVHQNSWGFTTRTIGIAIMMHSDDKGLILPPNAAPIQAVIVPIMFDNTKDELLKKCEEIKKSLKGIRVELDSRDEYTPGYKYHEWEMKGAPIRIEFGPKDMEKGHAVLVRRDTGSKEFAKLEDLAHKIKETLLDIHEKLYIKAEKLMEENIKDADTWKEFINIIEDKKIAKAAFCNGKKCEEELKDKSGGAKSINIPFNSHVHKGQTCIHCGKEAMMIALFAKSY